ncbi:VanZ family protein [Vallitalea okinawensis]
MRKKYLISAYLVLDVLAMNHVRKSDVVRYKSKALLICILYAVSDEVHY